MTEVEWLACTDHQPMLEFLRHKSSHRKLRLFACACCWHVLASRPSIDNDVQGALMKAEDLAEGRITQEEALRSRGDFESISPYSEKWSAFSAVSAALDKEVYLAAECAARHAVSHFGYPKEEHSSLLARILGIRQPAPRKKLLKPASVLRDIFGNPFRPTTIAPACRTSNVIAIAQAIYDERGFTDLSMVAGALEEAGSTNADILAHCRGPGPHVRGCWVIDALLGKS